MNHRHPAATSCLRADRSATFLAIFSLAFIILFVFAVAASAVGLAWRTLLPGAEYSKGFVAGVSGAVYTFMSHIT
ncbi:MAG: hypothetical protein FGM55_05685 [Rhodoferax sp.]|nr:hypothetical protein [Rhodoferax sp.]